MQKSTYLSKSLSWIIILVILYTHLCSFCCSTGILSCCSDGCSYEKEHHANTCHHENEGDDCQKDHIAFFNTLGQYHFIPADHVKVFQSLIAVIFLTETFQQKDIFYRAEIYTGFHPPPPPENLRILIQSFRI